MHIPMHATVSCYDGPVGKSSYIIVDLITEQITHFVVKTEEHGREFLAPLDFVVDSDRTVILLDCRKEAVYQLTPFHEAHFNGYDAYDNAPPAPSPAIAASYTMDASSLPNGRINDTGAPRSAFINTTSGE